MPLSTPPINTVTKIFNNIVLTSAYTGNVSETFEGNFIDQLTVLPKYTTGASETGTTCDIQLQISTNGTDWHTYGKADYTSGVLTITDIDYRFGGGAGDTEYLGAFQQIPVSSVYYRFRAKENGAPTNAGNLSMEVIESYT